jgi:hypothetical protein
MRNVSDKEGRENQNTHFVFSNFLKKILLFMGHVEKYCINGQTADDNMTHAHCMLHTKGYKHTLRICNTHCFSTAKMVVRTDLNVTLYVQYIVLCCAVELYKASEQLSDFRADRCPTVTRQVQENVDYERI